MLQRLRLPLTSHRRVNTSVNHLLNDIKYFSTDVEMLNNKKNACVVGGFSRCSNRQDFEMALIDVIEPVSIDPLLDTSYYSCGKYVVELPETESVQSFKQKLSLKSAGKYTVGSYFPESYHYKLASTNQVTNSTIRFKAAGLQVPKDHIYPMFQHFRIKSIRRVPLPTYIHNNFFIDMATADEAERAVIELGFGTFNDQEYHLHWYQS